MTAIEPDSAGLSQLALAAAALAMLGGCGVLGGKDKPETPTVGNRVPILSRISTEREGRSGAGRRRGGPAARRETNAEWPQAGGNADKIDRPPRARRSARRARGPPSSPAPASARGSPPRR